MATIVPAGVPASITFTFDEPGLFAGVTLWDDSGSVPVQITGQSGQVNGVYPAYNWSGNSYRVKVPAQVAGKWYLVQKGSYTDDTYTAFNDQEPQGDEGLFFQQSGSGASEFVGSVEPVLSIGGSVEPVVTLCETVED